MIFCSSASGTPSPVHSLKCSTLVIPSRGNSHQAPTSVRTFHVIVCTEDGVLVEEVDDLKSHWRDDLVGFLLGCSFTFEHPLMDAGMRMRHIELGVNVPMFITNRPCKPAGVFHGPLVVSMRPLPADDVVRAVQITSRFPAVHGAPIHVGDPAALGIRDVQRPDFGDAVPVAPGEVPVFWACGVTPQAVMMQAKPVLALTHAPGHMFISDRRDSTLAVL